MIPEILTVEISALLSRIHGSEVAVHLARPVSGGSINEAYRMDTDAGLYFLKYNHATRYPYMFEKEAKGLTMLREAGELTVPGVIGSGEAGQEAFLLLEYIDSATMKPSFWQDFGTSLAKMHQHYGEQFGLDYDNYMGSLTQSNRKHEDWISFFIDERLDPQARLGRNNGWLGSAFIAGLERLYKRLPDIFPVEPPTLVHGDLWSGNYMVDSRGGACLIDPAVHYGHREMDIAMSRLFGVFGEGFYEAYNREYPLEKSWRERVDICNLYPLLIHVNLFGGVYVGSVERIVGRF